MDISSLARAIQEMVTSSPSQRPGAALVRDLNRDRSAADAYLEQNAHGDGNYIPRVVSCTILKGRGDDLLAKKQYDAAQTRYIDALAALLGKDFTIPLPAGGGLRSEGYVALDGWEQVMVMECCNSMAKCSIAKDDKVKVRVCLIALVCGVVGSTVVSGFGMAGRSQHHVEEQLFQVTNSFMGSVIYIFSPLRKLSD